MTIWSCSATLVLGALMAAAVALGATGCTPAQATPSGVDGGGATASAPGLSCLQVVQCAVDCGADNACADACGEKGTAEGTANATALAACIDTEQCTDPTCVKDKCAGPVDVCVSSSAAPRTGTALEGSAPPGSVPSDLVGVWSGARNGQTERLTFNADGTGEWMSSDGSVQSACVSFNRTIRTGNFVVTDTTITVYATKVVNSVQQCAPPASESPLPPVTELIDWHRDANDPASILIIDAACAAKYPEAKNNCDTAGCPIGLYCTSRLKRE